MKRTKAIFDTVFGLSSASKSQDSYVLDFVSVDNSLPPDILAVRQKREAESLKTFLSQTQHLWLDLADLHSWLFTKHAAYGANRFTGEIDKEKISSEMAKTY